MIMRVIKNVILVCLYLLFAACAFTADEDLFDKIDNQPPQIVASQPADGWIQVPLGSTIRVWFSEPLDAASVNQGNISLFSGEVTEVVAINTTELEDGRGLLEVIPQRRLIPSVIYHLWISKKVCDLYGNQLPQAVWISFETMNN